MQACFFRCRDDAVGLPANTELDRTFGHARRTLAPRRRDGNARRSDLLLFLKPPGQEREGLRYAQVFHSSIAVVRETKASGSPTETQLGDCCRSSQRNKRIDRSATT